MIQEELNLSEAYLFELIENCDLVAITQNNVAIAESMIRNDSGYKAMNDTSAGPKKAYEGSSAFWFSQLKRVMNHEDVRFEIEEIISSAVNAVDRENSTHLNADGVGREQIAERILFCFNNGSLFNHLRNPEENNYCLIKLLSDETKPEEQTKNSRKNLSFASKFCHYAAYHLFDGLEKDNFSIWDSVLRRTIPLYLDYYQITNQYKLEEYPDYQKAIDDIIEQASQDTNLRVSRNGFDHLLWYYFRGRK